MTKFGRYMAGCAGLICAGASMMASAEPVQRTYTINAAGNCNGALPSYEGRLRKRPIGILNEGESNAFVNCSLPGDDLNEGNTYVEVGFTNHNADYAEFTCTFVDGDAPTYGDTDPPTYYPKGVLIVRFMPGHVDWTPAEGETFSTNANISCSLPPGVEINKLFVRFNEDNGVEPLGR